MILLIISFLVFIIGMGVIAYALIFVDDYRETMKIYKIGVTIVGISLFILIVAIIFGVGIFNHCHC